MPVKLSYSSYTMDRLRRLGLSVMCISSLSACASLGMPTPGEMWQDFTGERDPQMVTGPKRLPKHNQLVPSSNLQQADYDSYYSGSMAPSNAASPDTQIQTYVPVEPVEPGGRTSQPVILKHDDASAPSMDENSNRSPSTSEPSVFEHMTGWFSSGLAPIQKRNGQMVTIVSLVADIESEWKAEPQMSVSQDKNSFPKTRKPIAGNNLAQIEQNAKMDANLFSDAKMTPIPEASNDDTSDVPPLSSVPKVPGRLRQILKESAAEEYKLKRLHAASDDLRTALDAQRESEAEGSLLNSQNLVMPESSADDDVSREMDVETSPESEKISENTATPENISAVAEENTTISQPVVLKTKPSAELEPQQDDAQANAEPLAATIQKLEPSAGAPAETAFMPIAQPVQKVFPISRKITSKTISLSTDAPYMPLKTSNKAVQYLPKSRY